MTRSVVIGVTVALLIWGLSAQVSAAENICVRASRANLRAGPSTDHRITWEVNRYMPLTKVGEEGDWVKVQDVDGDLHWIYGPLVTDGVDCITIKAPRANIRKGPTTNAEKWFTVEKYTSFKQVGREGNWVQIEYEGEVMWVYYTLVWPT